MKLSDYSFLTTDSSGSDEEGVFTIRLYHDTKEFILTDWYMSCDGIEPRGARGSFKNDEANSILHFHRINHTTKQVEPYSIIHYTFDEEERAVDFTFMPGFSKNEKSTTIRLYYEFYDYEEWMENDVKIYKSK